MAEFLEFYRKGRFVHSGKPILFHVANAGLLLNKYGISGNVLIGSKAVNPRRHTNNEYHHLNEDEWFSALSSINNPLAIAIYHKDKDKNKNSKSYRIYTEVSVGSKVVCLGADVKKSGRDIEVTKISTGYGRNLINAMKNAHEEGSKETFVYPSEEKIKRIIEQSSHQHNSDVHEQQSVSDGKSTNNFETDKKYFKDSKDYADKYDEYYAKCDLEKAIGMYHQNGSNYLEGQTDRGEKWVLRLSDHPISEHQLYMHDQEDADYVLSIIINDDFKGSINKKRHQKFYDYYNGHYQLAMSSEYAKEHFDDIVSGIEFFKKTGDDYQIPTQEYFSAIREEDYGKEEDFHASVKRKDIRGMLGEGGYDNMLVDSYFNASKDARRKIASPKHRWDFSKATEEYLGDLAEKNFEDFDEADISMWNTIKKEVSKTLRYYGSCHRNVLFSFRTIGLIEVARRLSCV